MPNVRFYRKQQPGAEYRIQTCALHTFHKFEVKDGPILQICLIKVTFMKSNIIGLVQLIRLKNKYIIKYDIFQNTTLLLCWQV